MNLVWAEQNYSLIFHSSSKINPALENSVNSAFCLLFIVPLTQNEERKRTPPPHLQVDSFQ